MPGSAKSLRGSSQKSRSLSLAELKKQKSEGQPETNVEPTVSGTVAKTRRVSSLQTKKGKGFMSGVHSTFMNYFSTRLNDYQPGSQEATLVSDALHYLQGAQDAVASIAHSDSAEVKAHLISWYIIDAFGGMFRERQNMYQEGSEADTICKEVLAFIKGYEICREEMMIAQQQQNKPERVRREREERSTEGEPRGVPMSNAQPQQPSPAPMPAPAPAPIQ